MTFIKQFERLKKAHQLILNENTGTPDEFAGKLGISRSWLYNLLQELKEIGAPLKYNKKIASFYYTSTFDIELKYSLKIITDEEARLIFGGVHNHPMLLDGILFNLSQQNPGNIYLESFGNSDLVWSQS